MRRMTTWALSAMTATLAAGCADNAPLDSSTLAMSAIAPSMATVPCDPIPIETNPALVYDDLDRLEEHFQLREVLGQILTMAEVVAPQTPDELWHQWWRSLRTRQAGDPADEPRCGEGTGAEINGFPLVCDRPEADFGFEPDHEDAPNFDTVIETHQPVQLVNRFDLMPLNGDHCGEYRIVYGMKDSPGVNAPFGDNLIIFEGVVPNPDKSCGAAGCRPIVDFWARLSELDEDERIDELKRFYFDGLTEIDMEPVIRPEAYGVGGDDAGSYNDPTGQIRTNQFVFQQSWSLREFHLDRVCTTVTIAPEKNPSLKTKKRRKFAKSAATGITLLSATPKPTTTTTCKLYVRPAPVANNPFEGLFDGTSPEAILFQGGIDDEASFLSQLEVMIPSEPNEDGSWPTETVNDITMATDPQWNAAESIENGGSPTNPLNTYDIVPKSAFADAIASELPAQGGYTVNHIANRATAVGCAGCHDLSKDFSRRQMGNGVVWDSNDSFTHINRNGVRSDIMDAEFLPHRQSFMARYLAATCEECTEAPLLRTSDGDLLTEKDFTDALKDTGLTSKTLAKDVVVLGGDATLSGSQTH